MDNNFCYSTNFVITCCAILHSKLINYQAESVVWKNASNSITKFEHSHKKSIHVVSMKT